MTNATFYSLERRKSRKICLDANSDLILLRDSATLKYLGMLRYGSSVARAITALNNTPTISIATRCRLGPNEDQMEIQVYGKRHDGAAVGDVLSANNVFLQEPDKASAPYLNPQSLSHAHGSSADHSDDDAFRKSGSTALSRAMASELYDALGTTEVPDHFRQLDVNDKLLTPLKR